MLKSVLVLASLIQTAALAGDPGGLVYSGKTNWDTAAGILTFQTSGSFPESKEGFHWAVPADVRKIVIDEAVTVRGAFRISYRHPNNPLFIIGKNRETSVLYGTETERWTTENKIAENDKWRYGAAGSTITDSLISTSDDGIKVYNDITIKNVTIEQHRNGAPIQFGWGGETQHAKAKITNLTIKGVAPDQLYNMAPFTWEAGSKGTRDVSVIGLKVKLVGKLYDESAMRWLSMGLFELKPKDCTCNLTIVDAEIEGMNVGLRHTQGTITINSAILK